VDERGGIFGMKTLSPWKFVKLYVSSFLSKYNKKLINCSGRRIG
jgi:hypothetical protein